MAFLRILLATVAVALFSGCGGGGEGVDQDTSEFNSAIVTYLKNKSMGMSIKEFKTLTVTDDGAEARVSLKATEGGGPSVTWTFKFKKDEGGGWKVTQYIQN